MSSDAPLLVVQVRLAVTEVLLGDPAAARRRLRPWVGRFDTCLHEPEALSTLGVLAQAVVLLSWKSEASTLFRLLRPFAGRQAGANGVVIDLPVDHHLAALALLDGDVVETAACGHRAVTFARRMHAPPSKRWPSGWASSRGLWSLLVLTSRRSTSPPPSRAASCPSKATSAPRSTR